MTKPLALILKGDGINCDNETVWALELAGFRAQAVHVSAFIEDQSLLHGAKLLALPGGFAFGDEIASGKVLALKLRERMIETLYQFIGGKGLVIGICNGFQVLTQLGILPRSQPQARRLVTLTKNSHGHFNNRWVDLTVAGPAEKGTASKEQKMTGAFFSGLKNIELPIRHGEGRLVVGTGVSKEQAGNARSSSMGGEQTEPELIDFENEVKSCAPLRYRDDVNGSFDRIAALTNAEGSVLGLMPHPEAFVRWTQHPAWTTLKLTRPELAADRHPLELPLADRPHGFTILRNAFEMV
jgi:phosphoribosylformylglycinamidine (FGAM) synthase-like amidotransferase family enzyme